VTGQAARPVPSSVVAAFVPLLTPRLVLRRLTAADATTVAAYRGDADIARYQAWGPGDAEPTLLADWFTRHAADEADTAGGPGLLIAITRRDDGRVVGDCSLQVKADDRDRVTTSGYARVAELGYSLAPAHHRQGYATEATAALCAWVMAAFDLAAIYALVDHRNRPSIAVAERLGMIAVEGVQTKVRGQPTVMIRFERTGARPAR
jgi:RimJ/RimL family protein N-acetyltransferase